MDRDSPQKRKNDNPEEEKDHWKKGKLGNGSFQEVPKEILEVLQMVAGYEAEDDEGGASRAIHCAEGHARRLQYICDKAKMGLVTSTSIIDFPYSDKYGVQLSEDQQFLTRAFVLKVNDEGSSPQQRIVIHVHTLLPWKLRHSVQYPERVDRLTAVNWRIAERPLGCAHFTTSGLGKRGKSHHLVPVGQALMNWRDRICSTESDCKGMIWEWRNPDSRPSEEDENDPVKLAYENARLLIGIGQTLFNQQDVSIEESLSPKDTDQAMRGLPRFWELFQLKSLADASASMQIDPSQPKPISDPVEQDKIRVAALCIGIDNYKNVRKLNNAVADAREVHRQVEKLCCSRSKFAEDVRDTKEMVQAVRRFASSLTSISPTVALIMIAGHGIEHQRKLYFLPADASPERTGDLQYDCVCLDTIYDELREHDTIAKGNTVYVVIVDTCRSSFGTNIPNLPIDLDADAQRQPRNLAVAFSCSRGSVALDSADHCEGHSPFAAELLNQEKGMFAPGVPLRSALQEASQRLKALGLQEPRLISVDNIPEDLCLAPLPPRRAVRGLLSPDVAPPSKDIQLGCLANGANALVELRRAVLKPGTISVISGMPGIGKTVLASSVAHDNEVKEECYDGIAWITLGINPDIAQLQRVLYQQVTQEPLDEERYRSLEERKLLCHQSFGPLRLMVVLDDVWEVEHAKALIFLNFQQSNFVRFLLTTQKRGFLDVVVGVNEFSLSSLDSNASVRFFSSTTKGGNSEPSAVVDQHVDSVAEVCAGVPLALAASRDLNTELGGDWASVSRSLMQHCAVRTCIERSLSQLSKSCLGALTELAAFPPGCFVPTPALTVLWGDAWATVRQTLVSRSLLVRDSKMCCNNVAEDCLHMNKFLRNYLHKAESKDLVLHKYDKFVREKEQDTDVDLRAAFWAIGNLNSERFASILQTFDRHRTAACWALKGLSTQGEWLSKAPVVNLTVQIMNVVFSGSDDQREILAVVIANMSCHQQFMNVAAKDGGVAKALVVFAKSQSILQIEVGVTTMAHLSSNPKCLEYLHLEGVIFVLMKLYDNSVRVDEAISFIFSRMCEVCSHVLVDAGAIPALVRRIAHGKVSEKMNATKVLCSFASDDGNLDAMRKASVLETMLSECENSQELLDGFLTLVSRFAVDSQYQHLVCNIQLVATLVKLCYDGTERHKEKAVGLVASLPSNDLVQDALRNAGAIQAFLKVLEHGSTSSQRESSMRFLCCMLGNQDNVLYFKGLGLAAIFTIARAATEGTAVQKSSAINALKILSQNGMIHEQPVLNRAILHAIEHVFEGGNTEQKIGAASLLFDALSVGSIISVELFGMIPKLVALLFDVDTADEIVFHTLELLVANAGAVVANEDIKEALLKAPTVEAVVYVATQGSEAQKVLAAEAIYTLCWIDGRIDSHIQDRFRDAGAIARVVQLLGEGGEQLQEATLCAVTFLASNNLLNQNALQDAGAIAGVVRFLGAPKVELCNAAIVSIFALVNNNASNQNAVRQAGAIAVLARLVWEGPEDLKQYAAKLLGCLAKNNQVNQDAIRSAGGVSSLRRLFREGTEVQRQEATHALQAMNEGPLNCVLS